MSFDLDALQAAVRKFGRVVRIVVADVQGSAPRDVGAAMLVWKGGQSGTIGGGRLEFDASAQALQALENGDWLNTFPLGPALGQCCGGSVTLLAECYDAARLAEIMGQTHLRRVKGAADVPLAIQSQLKMARNAGHAIKPSFASGWMLEPISSPTRQLWIYGAGHVGRAIVDVLAPLPEIEIHWVDTAENRFPDTIPDGVHRLVSAHPADVVRYAPHDGEHLILTYSHAFDLELCHRLLGHGFSRAGLIGSKTKWARFRSRLRDLGHGDAQISRIECPIGQPHLGKHPQAIAVGVAAALLSQAAINLSVTDRVG